MQRAVEARWGKPEQDPHLVAGKFRLGLHRFGNAVVGVQPARGYNIDPKSTYHDPDLVPPHHYLAFYLWLRREFDLHAIVHLGKHGNLEWLPGKSTGLSADCLPDAVLGPLPHLYPFIVNDPGEGIQAKRRASAVIIDHLTPPMTRAELHDDLARLETLVDEYALAADLDPQAGHHARRGHSVTGAGAAARCRRQRDTGHADQRRPARARCASLRSQGNADPRRPAYLRPSACRTASATISSCRSRGCRVRT